VFAARALRVGFADGYNQVTVPYLAEGWSWGRIPHVLFGLDWGLAWMSPWWLLCLVVAAPRARKLTLVSWACALAMAAHLVLCFSWRGHGSDFGYRYLIGTFPAALLLWLSMEKGRALERVGIALVRWGALWTTYLTWVYRASAELTPRRLSPDWGALVPNFQWEALKRLADIKTLLAPLARAPLAALWCSRETCAFSEATVFGAQWWGLLTASLACVLTLFWLARPSTLRR
jgi:hypothetical protein